jgi:phosphatidate phosphatase APP1
LFSARHDGAPVKTQSASPPGDAATPGGEQPARTSDIGRDEEVVFFYVSGSPWQLYPLLAESVDAEGYPRGSFDLKHFRLKDRSMLGLLPSREATKLRAIEAILAACPERRFILISDSGEQDPEIYVKVARDHPGRVAAILIRSVRGEKIGDERFQSLRKGLQGVRLELFEHPETIIGPLIE